MSNKTAWIIFALIMLMLVAGFVSGNLTMLGYAMLAFGLLILAGWYIKRRKE